MALRILPNDRRRIAAHRVGPIDPPESAPGGCVQRHQKAVYVMVLVQNDFALDDDRRTAGAILVAERSHALVPQLLSLQVVAKQACAAEKREQPLAVGRD